jgi:hypothetical protein
VELLDLIAALLVLAGMLGVLLPVLPGTPLIFAGALVYDYAHDWTAFGWGWLAVLLLLTLLSEIGDWALGHIGARRGGASWKALLAGAVLGMIGLFLLPPFGFLIGSIVGVGGVELLSSGDRRRALRASGGWFVGWALSLLLQGTVAVIMVAIVLWRGQYP